nr:MAG TPA: hypothetical protein [Caudoviricetes sp.]
MIDIRSEGRSRKVAPFLSFSGLQLQITFAV